MADSSFPILSSSLTLRKAYNSPFLSPLLSLLQLLFLSLFYFFQFINLIIEFAIFILLIQLNFPLIYFFILGTRQ